MIGLVFLGLDSELTLVHLVFKQWERDFYKDQIMDQTPIPFLFRIIII